jgi:hypothetical protein
MKPIKMVIKDKDIKIRKVSVRPSNIHDVKKYSRKEKHKKQLI